MAYKPPPGDPIAVVGSSCRFAGGATSTSKLWDVLCKAPDLSREVPPARFNAKAFYHPDGEYHGTTNSIKGYWLEQDHRVFDATMFNMNPVEAEATDPQQRLLLEVVYEAMESAGYTLSTYSGKKVAVFAGVMTADYDTLSQRDDLSASQYYATGNARSIISNRISYCFNFQGPSMTIDTACSSSLVALHQAVLSLRSNESVMACVAGVNLMITPEQFIVESSLHMLSPSGKSRMWDASADGYARGEGVAALLLKPLSRALADGDEIAAIIRETGTNSDGRTPGITLPNPQAQASLVRDTYSRSGLDASVPEDQCQYFEAHGTGTPAGDPREAEAIHGAFFGDNATDTDVSNANHLLVGSIKTVLGHTEGAAGLAGLLKVIEAMKHGSVPPNLHLNSINPKVKPFCKRLQIPTSLVPWPTPPPGQPKRASVNSFGFGGSNAHVIVEAFDPRIHAKIYQQQTVNRMLKGFGRTEGTEDRPFFLPLLLSAASQKSLRAVVASYRDYLLEHPNVCHGQLSLALSSRRTTLPYRLAVSASSRTQALETLSQILSKEPPTSDLGIRSKSTTERPKVLGVFTGQGAQWATMSRSLFHTNEIYRDTIRRLDDVLKSCPEPPEWTLEEQIMAERNASLVDVAAVSQPLCTAIQVGLVDLLTSLGVGFHTVVGHSSGEIAAAYAAGKISAKDAILISYYRGSSAHLAGGCQGQKGGMLAVGISKEEALEFCSQPIFSGKIHVAASNAPSSVTLSGDMDAIQMAHGEFTASKRFSRVLRVDSAYHSPHMSKPAVAYVKALQSSDIKSDAQGNGTFWVSSVHGRSMSGNEDLDSTYWKDNMVNMVRFDDAVVNALSKFGPFGCAVEIGPHAALKGPFTQTAKSLEFDIPYLSALDRSKDDSLAFSDILGSLWSFFGLQGANLPTYVGQLPSLDILGTNLTDLPPYPWDHSQIHYREPRISRNYHQKSDAPHELLGSRTRDDNDHELRWRNILRPAKLPWVEHHSFQGQALLPASAYCIMALDAAYSLLRGRPASLIELHDMQILSGINVEGEFTGVEVLFTLAIRENTEEMIEAGITLASCPANGTTNMRLNMTATIKIHLGEPALDALPPRNPSESECLGTTHESFYHMMEQIGLTYTGPFRALDSIQRRYNCCSGSLKRWHPEDTTTLRISPATLDSCFQSAFLTYSSPGDNALWYGFLPVRIDRMSFNLATYDRLPAADKNDTLTVDAQMGVIQPATSDSKATFTVDIGIFNGDGVMEIQVEGLTVSAIANTQAKDDYELYLHTVMDVDPSHEIVQGNFDLFDPTDDPSLVESFVRVATFFVKSALDATGQSPDLSSYYKKLSEEFPSTLGTTVADNWPSDTREVIDKLIEDSDYYNQLSLLPTLGNFQSDFVLDFLKVLITETHHISSFKRHVGRVAKQIVHRYPQMSILGLAGVEAEFLTDVLTAIGSSFRSFTIGSGEVRNLEKRVQMLESTNKKIVSSPLDLAGDIKAQLGTETSYDLVMLSASQLEKNIVNVLKGIHDIMVPGGFLVLVQRTTSSMKDRLLPTKPQDSVSETSTPPEWPDYLDAYGFIQVANNCNQSYYLGSTIMVWQLKTPELELIKQPSQRADAIADDLLIIGGVKNYELLYGLRARLLPLCGRVSMQPSFDNIDSQELASCDAAIILADLDEPLMATMTQHRLDQLRELLRPNMKVLWLTRDAISGNPDNAATFGFTRTVSAEVPQLVLQMLDLEAVEGADSLVADTLIRLMVTNTDQRGFLWSDEKEIYIRGGKRLVPRVLPLKQSNDRVNAMRRVISEPANTLRESIEVVPRCISGGSVRYETRADQLSDSTKFGHVRIRVNFSSVDAIRLDSQTHAYVCLGYDMSTDKPVIALSQSNASYVSVPRAFVRSTYTISDFGLPLMSLATRYLVANVIASQARTRRVILIDSDPELTQCVAECVDGNIVCYSTTTATGNDLDGICAPQYLHPHASSHKIREMFPRSGGFVVDLQPEVHKSLSELIAKLIPAKSGYFSRSSLFGANHENDASTPLDPANWMAWGEALMGADTKIGKSITSSYGRSDTISLPALQSSTGTADTSPFRIIDWRAERTVESIVQPHAAEQLFRADRTYVLVGLTRDLGQSLCYMLVKHGARNIVLASRNPDMQPKWAVELGQEHGARIEMRKCDVTDFESVVAFKNNLRISMPPIAGVANGAMVLDDRVFAQMDIDTWNRVLRPKTVGSSNLDVVFDDDNLEFFIMTSSFAAVGGHPGQSNYAAANMYMNGLAANRRRRGLAGSVLNIGVIYGLGLLQREKGQLYAGLEREGYPPISERDIHHMFLEAVIAGPPGDDGPDTFIDFTTGLSRFDPADPNPLHWHQDPRFGHYNRPDSFEDGAAATGARQSLMDAIAELPDKSAIADAIMDALAVRLTNLLHLPEGAVNPAQSMSELGVDSLAAVEARSWIFKSVGKDVSVIKLLGSISLQKLCGELAEQIVANRENNKDIAK
ncbi:DNA replication protein [Hypoxylon texense]